LVGAKPPWVLIDAGQPDTSNLYIPVLEQAVLENCGVDHLEHIEIISDIVLTHRHGDHHGGVPSVLALLRRLWGDDASRPFPNPKLHMHPLPDAAPHDHRDSLLKMVAELPAGLQSDPFKALSDNQVLSVPTSSSTPGASLRVIHVPGHTADSVALYLEEDNILFTADTVLGRGTAVFDDLAAYIQSLRKLSGIWAHHPAGCNTGPIYPGHGPVVEDGRAKIEAYISHRLEREGEILSMLRSMPADSLTGETRWSIEKIVKKLYVGYPENIWQAAGGTVKKHLIKLQEEGRVRIVNDEWELVSPKL